MTLQELKQTLEEKIEQIELSSSGHHLTSSEIECYEKQTQILEWIVEMVDELDNQS